MIVVIYEEEKVDSTSGATTYESLGVETHQDIDEVMLPSNPESGSPIFLTKKFSGNDEYRWQVQSVCQRASNPSAEYLVTLSRRKQVPKECYLKNILASRGDRVRKVIHQWALVEVEFGHSLTVGKANGDIKSNKRYADTIQLYSMPKRRLAIVIQVIERPQEDLLQVVPISSKRPFANDRSAVEVTADLVNLVHYQKRSWAACKMIQTVTASRIIAPMTKVAHNVARDRGFRSKVRGPIRDLLKDALMFGVSAATRVSDTQALALERSRTALLMTQSAQLGTQAQQLATRVADLEARLEIYEQFVRDSGMKLEGVQEMYAPGVQEIAPANN